MKSINFQFQSLFAKTVYLSFNFALIAGRYEVPYADLIFLIEIHSPVTRFVLHVGFDGHCTIDHGSLPRYIS